MFISMRLADGNGVTKSKRSDGKENRRLKKINVYMDTTEVFTSKMTITIFLNMATVA